MRLHEDMQRTSRDYVVIRCVGHVTAFVPGAAGCSSSSVSGQQALTASRRVTRRRSAARSPVAATREDSPFFPSPSVYASLSPLLSFVHLSLSVIPSRGVCRACRWFGENACVLGASVPRVLRVLAPRGGDTT